MEVAYDMVDTLNSSSTVSWTKAPLTSDLYGTANTTDNSTTPQYVGYIGAGVAVLFYGSNFIPVKKFETGDGMFFQLVLCTAILFVGVIVNLIRNAPKFYPIVMLGGAFWATGNVCVVPIIKTIGMGLGLCIWGSSNLLAGWASGRFGMFGWIKPEEPSDSTLNYIGVSMAVLSTAIYLFVRSEVSTSLEVKVEEVWDPEREPLLAPPSENPSINVNGWNPDVPKSDKLEKEEKPDAEIEDSFLERMSPLMKRIVGSVLSLISGIFYGISFAPAIHVQDMVEGSSQNGLDYVFAHFIGIYFTSLVYFIIYAAFMKNVPRVYPKMILPALLSGGMWGVATTCWFIANKVLSEPVSFPIITTGPGVVASLWGVLVFKEIQGRRNIILLILAFLATLTCGVLSGLSDR